MYANNILVSYDKMCHYYVFAEIATSAPRGENHMGQVGVVNAGHMTTSDSMI